MNYRVDWIPEALNQLAAVWMLAGDRKAVNAAEARVSQLLTRDPFNNGQHVSEGLYRLVVPPLIVTYTIDQGQRVVTVDSVRPVP